MEDKEIEITYVNDITDMVPLERLDEYLLELKEHVLCLKMSLNINIPSIKDESIEIFSIDDIVNKVPLENFDEFLIDLRHYVLLTKTMKHNFGEVINTFTWINDGDHKIEGQIITPEEGKLCDLTVKEDNIIFYNIKDINVDNKNL